MKNIILVDENDNEVGITDKLTAHQQALCHRAFSIFIFRHINEKIELLLQQRKEDKYHCGGLWTNTCCSHPMPGETVLKAANRRLKEEMGFSVPLESMGVFHYIASFDNGLTENEVDHVLIGWYDDEMIMPNEMEIAKIRWVELAELQQTMAQQPAQFTPWFAEALVIATKGIVQ